MKRLITVALTCGAALLLTGCGTSTFTLNGKGVSGKPASMVVTADNDVVAQAKQSASSGSNGDFTISDGDNHQGGSVCQFDYKSKGGHSYHFAVYGDLPPAVCSDQSGFGDLP